MDGYLLIDKPKGWTSFDVVNKLRFMLSDISGQPAKKLKVGHTGTLDPNATGLLIVLVGNYTKRQQEFMKLDKTYWAQVTLGATSDTDDADGQTTRSKQPKTVPYWDEVEAALDTQIGSIQQLPPQYSAIKRAGQPAYKLARQGALVELKPRPVTVHSIDDIRYAWPKLEFRASVSSGTYIRSIARDIGQVLGLGGYLQDLRRESIGAYSIGDSLKLKELSPGKLKGHIKQT